MDEQLEAAVLANANLKMLDLRLNPVEADSLRKIKREMVKRTAALAAAERKKLQEGGWDLVM